MSYVGTVENPFFWGELLVSVMDHPMSPNLIFESKFKLRCGYGCTEVSGCEILASICLPRKIKPKQNQKPIDWVPQVIIEVHMCKVVHVTYFVWYLDRRHDVGDI